MGPTRALLGTATGLVASLLLAGCSPSVTSDGPTESEPPQTTSAGSETTSAEESEAPEEPHVAAHIKAKATDPGRDSMKVDADYGLEFGVGVDGVKVWMVAVVDDQGYSIGDLATAHFELRDEEGEVLSAAKESQRFWTGDKLIFPMYMKLPDGIDAHSAHVDVVVEKDEPNTPAPDERASIEIKSTILSATGEQPVMAFTVKNPSKMTATKSRIDIICYDDQKRIIGGGQVTPPPISASQTMGLHSELVTTGTPDTCQLFPAVLQSQDPIETEAEEE